MHAKEYASIHIMYNFMKINYPFMYDPVHNMYSIMYLYFPLHIGLVGSLFTSILIYPFRIYPHRHVIHPFLQGIYILQK